MEHAAAPEVDEAALAVAVERLHGRPVGIASWQVAPIESQSLGLAGPVFRIAGTTQDGSSWSLILKSLRTVTPAFLARFAEGDRQQVAEAYLWDREARLCGSGLLDKLPSGFRAARCLGAQRQEDTCALWFEDLGDNAAHWDAARYALAARHLGRFNGALSGPESLPDAPWLCRGWIRSWVTQGLGASQARMIENDAIWDHELVRDAFAPDARGRLRRAWAQRDAILARLDALPHTFCHMDAFRPNLFDHINGAGERETVAIDWSYAGNGPLGAEVGQLVLASTAYADRTHTIGELAAVALPAYIAGLREGGWHGDDRDVHEGYGLSAIRWLFMLGPLSAILDAERQEQVARWSGLRYPEVVAQLGGRTEILLDLVLG